MLETVYVNHCIKLGVFFLVIAVMTPETRSLARDGQPARTRITFAVMGDIPYSAEEYQLLRQQVAELPADAEFVVHVGDIKTGQTPCEAKYYQDAADILKQSKIPVFILPGDNEWNDCTDPDSAWTLWTKHFDRFENHWKHPLPVKRQDKRGENFAFVRSEVLFLGINVVGGRVHDPEEWKKRHSENLEWTRQNLKQYRDSIACLVVFGHAFPLKVHDDYFQGLSESAAEFKKPVLYLHGDGHRWIRNRPFAALNIERIQVDQGGIAPPIKVTITDDPKEPFVVDRRKAEE
jgi:hypothetical protein